MALEGELDVVEKCPDCGSKLPIRVCLSGAGYYIGQFCDHCGPYSRLSYDYYPTHEVAQKHLNADDWKRRDTEFHPGPLTVIELKKEQSDGRSKKHHC